MNRPAALGLTSATVLMLTLSAGCGGKTTEPGSRTDKPGRGSSQRDHDAATDEHSRADDAGVSNDGNDPVKDDEPAPDDADSAASSPGSNDEGSEPSSTGAEPSVDGTEPGSSEDLPRFDCSEASPQFDPENMNALHISEDVAAAVESTLQAMSPAQKASQLLGIDASSRNYRDIMRSPDVEVPEVGVVRGFRYRDGSRGVNLDAGQPNRTDDQKNFATVFPTASLRAASWNPSLERRIGAAIGDETAASQNNVLLAPCMNIVRHPYWGRTQETYGEDGYLIGRMATAFTVGVQQYVTACARHFAANNIESKRIQQDATMSEQTLREVYSRHFEMVVRDGGVGCVMAANNLVNGVKATQNEHLLRDVLKAPLADGGMGFSGFVLTDLWAMPGAQSFPDAITAQTVANEALSAGTDVELPWSLHYNETTLANADQTLVEEAARRVLTQKFRFGTALDTDGWSAKAPTSTLTEGSITANESHEALAEEAVIESAVLLSNGVASSPAVLPLTSAANIAVIGPEQQFKLVSSSTPMSCGRDTDGSQGQFSRRDCVFHFATDPAFGDRGSSLVNGDPERAVGPFAGIEQVAGDDRTVTSGNSVDAAAAADAVVVVVGYTPGDEGEEYPIEHGGDRGSLDLPPGHNELVQSVLDLDKPTVIIVESGSIVNLPWLSHSNEKQATIWAGYPGLRGGVALGKLIFGEANFSGKMPLAWPAESELPVFRESDTVTTMGYFFGYREYDRRQYIEGSPVDLLFPFGHGLSYSTFEYANLSVPCDTASQDAVINVSVDIENTSTVDGDEIAMLFVKPPARPSSVIGERPWKELKSFARVSVAAGQTVTAQLPLRIADLRRWEGGEDGKWVIDSGDYTLLVAKDAAAAESTGNVVSLTVEGD